MPTLSKLARPALKQSSTDLPTRASIKQEDALDMRKALPRDTLKKSVVPLKRPVRPEELEED